MSTCVPDACSTPCSNTGLHSHRVAVNLDCVSLLWEECDVDVLHLLVSSVDLRFDLTVNMPRKIGVFWDYCYKSAGGSLYMFRRTAKGLAFRLALSGTDCSRINQDLLIHLLGQMYYHIPGLRCSRLDIALDDFDKRLDPALLIACIEQGNFSGVNDCDYVRNLTGSGWTLYLGRRQSEYFGRYYNKSAESRGRVDSYRFESEYKGAKSDYLFRVLVNLPTVAQSRLALRDMLFGSIKFYTRREKNLSRSVIAPWWTEYVESIRTAEIVAVVTPAKSSIECKKAWIERQVSRSLALISAALGVDAFHRFFDELIANGTAKMRRLDDLFLLEYETENSC